jgi:sortase A
MAKSKNSKKLYIPAFRLHFGVIAGFLTIAAVLAFFNAQLLAALTLTYISPASAASQEEALINLDALVDDQPKIIIPKIGVSAPTVYGMDSVQEEDVQKALEKGVLHFGGSPLPGQPGNAVFVGHSSNTPWAAGDYKFVFMLLDKLDTDDKIYMNYKGSRYTYQVTSKKVVKPNDVSVLEGSLYPIATFITCTPLGTNINRLVITAQLIDPTPTIGNEDALVRSAPELNGTLPGDGTGSIEALAR